jgi:hypothetical protein
MAQALIQPLMIVGCPRSGTFLLCVFLEAHFGIVTPTETHFIPYFQRYLFLWGDLAKKENRARLLQAIYEFLTIWIPRNMSGRDPLEARRYSLLITRPESAAIVDNSSSYPELLQALFTTYARLQGKEYAADKSAFFSVVPLATLQKSLPEMRVVHIVRDGRDVCLSWLKTWFPPHNLCQAASLWAKHVADKRAWGREHQDRYLEIRYEDLVVDAEMVRERLSKFLGLKPEPEPMPLEQIPLARMLVTGSTHQQLGKRLNSDNIGKSSTQFSAADLRRLNAVAGGVLKQSGYDFGADSRVTLLDRMRICISIHMLPFLQKMFYLRATKPVLPLVIFACQLFDVSLSRILNRAERFKGWQ